MKLCLRQKVAGLPRSPAPMEYVVRAWDYVLSDEHYLNEEVDTVPYVPFVPEDFGVELTAESRVLDVGCLGGHGLYDFAGARHAQSRPVPRLVGVDISTVPLTVARDFAGEWAGDGSAGFCAAVCEALPFRDASFDLVILRLVLPYVLIDRSLTEVSRVLRPGGLAFCQLHSTRYYLRSMVQAARHVRRPSDLRRILYYAKPPLSQALFVLTGYQPRHRWLRQTAMSPRTLRRLAPRYDLHPVWEGRFTLKPQVLLRKGQATDGVSCL